MGDLIAEVLLRAILLPSMFVVASPFVLIAALFGDHSYLENTVRGYIKVFKAWESILDNM